MVFKIKLYPVFLCALFSLFLSSFVAAYASDDNIKTRPRRILIISTFHLNHPWTADFNSNIMRRLNESGLDFSVDFLELNAIQRRNINFAAKFQPYLASIKNHEYDVIVAILGDAIKVLEDNYDAIPRDLPMLCARDQEVPPGYQERYPSMTGTQNDADVFRNVELGLSLMPKATGALIITDDIDSGAALYRRLQSQKDSFKKCKLEIINGADYSTPEVLSKVASLPPDWFVVFAPWRNFVKDGFFSLEQVAGELQSRTPNPYFVITDVLLGRGALGGYVSRGETHGKMIADQMIQVFSGVLPSSIKFIHSPRELVIDMSVMRKYSLPVNYLPKNLVMINRRMPIYEEYQTESISILIAFGSVLFLLVFMHLHHRRFRRMSLQNNFLLDTGGSMAQVSYFYGDEKGRVCLIGGNMEVGIPYDGQSHYMQDWILPEERDEFNRAKERVVRGEPSSGYKGVFHSKWSGKKRSYQLLVSECLHDGHFLVVLRDITDIESADRARSYFLATLSHEIRTPLNAISGFAELLQDDGLLETERKEYARVIRSSGKALLELINDVLDLAKLESGQLEALPVRCNVGQLANEILSVYQLEAAKKGIFINQVSRVQFPVYLNRVRVRQMLVNLIGNAIKFTSVGGVTLAADFYVEDNQFGCLELSVIDSGCGISEADQITLFNPFSPQNNSEPREKYSSDGLGLAVCRRMLEHIGGTIEVKSELGKGCCFKVLLKHVAYDLESEDKAPEETLITSVLEGQKNKLAVLVVDDVPLNAKLLCAMLKKLGVDVQSASSGAEALTKLEKFHPALVLTDMWMPEMNGAELAKDIRGKEQFGKINIYALTADRDAALNFSMDHMDGVLFKPISIGRLKELLVTVSQTENGCAN